MDLLDRYLQAVKFWLPARQKQDIIAELSEDIRSQIEDQEAALGRPINAAEVEALLKRVGRPVLVANKYLAPQYLIGPLWFPIYAFVVKIVAACSLAPGIIIWISLMSFNPSYRAAHVGAGWVTAIGEAWGGFWQAAMLAIGTVTLVFAVLERAQAKSGLLEQWDPRKLPPVRDPNRISRANSTTELVANIVFCSWWITEMWSPFVLSQPSVRVELAPVWPTFFVGFLMLALVNIGIAAVNLLRPYWTRASAGVKLATDLVGSVFFCALCRSSIVSSISVAGLTADRTAAIAGAINRVALQVFPLAILLGLVIFIVNARRVFRANSGA